MDELVRPDDMRVGDRERAAVQERLRRAVGGGQLDLSDFDTRVRSVWAARTRGELARVTRDLPEPPAAPPPPLPLGRLFTDDAAGLAMRVLAIVWATVLAINLVVWGLVEVTTESDVHPWWIWVAGPGAALAVLYAAGIGRPRR